MPDVISEETELARRFAEDIDAIAARGAAPDCAERMAAINAAFDVQCARLKAEEKRDGRKRRFAEP